MFLRRSFLSLAFLSFCCVLSGCGGSSHTAPAPTFTSTPVTAGAQGTAYSYSVAATDPYGGNVSFALTSAPTGAALSGNTVNWTPPSRAANNFTVTATTSEGGSATQTWTVNTSGTVTVNWVNTYWAPSGQAQVPVVSADSLEVSAVVPQSDGSLTVLKATATGPGVFTIPTVPAGNYWLAFGGLNLLPDSTSAYWTNATTFDAGRDFAGSPEPLSNSTNTTQFNLNLSGMDSVNAPTNVLFNVESQIPAMMQIDQSNTTSATLLTGVANAPIDWSQVSGGFIAQYVPSTLGPYTNFLAVGPSATLSNLSITSGTTNTITQALQPGTLASLDVAVQGSQWAVSFTGASVAQPISYASAFSVGAEPFVQGTNAPASLSIESSLLFAGTSSFPPPPGVFPLFPEFQNCDTGFIGISAPNPQPSILTNQDLGTLQYGDSFPSTWTRVEGFCEEAIVPVAVPGSNATANFALQTSVRTAPSNSPLTPVVGPVQSPTVNGSSLFTAATLSTTTPTLSWSVPATGSPYGYRVSAFVLIGTGLLVPPYQPAGVFYTSQTSTTLPPLSAGNTYVFSITSLQDGTANIQTGPFRSSLPSGLASVISAPITISSGAASPAIHGDERVVRQLREPKRQSKPPVVHEN